MVITSRDLALLYHKAHNIMRNSDGLQPQEAFDELLKYLFFKQLNEERGPSLKTDYELAVNGSYSKNAVAAVADIRSLFSEYLDSINAWSAELWKDRRFHLTDATLFELHELLREIVFRDVPFDIRSAALKEFLPPEIRRGLGIYLTPEDVVRAMVNFVSPQVDSRVYDIAVGSGTFLIEVLRLWTKNGTQERSEVWGTDKNPRMLLLADLNLGHVSNVRFHRRLMDSIFDTLLTEGAQWPSPNSFDYIFTNPPFGIALDSRSHDISKFRTCRTSSGDVTRKQASEVIFIEQSLKLLKPGGTLAIVLPKSVITNLKLNSAREAINDLGYVYAIMVLPSETFQLAGTQTTTAVLFIKKFEEAEKRSDKVRVCLADVNNVGYDSTGRFKSGNQLLQLPEDLRKSIATGRQVGVCRPLPAVQKDRTLVDLPNLLSGKNEPLRTSKKLGDLVQIICTGKTPARSDYSLQGLFLVKVGNLTGNGISWIPRDRNFIDGTEAAKRRSTGTLMLRKNDILLTSSAHTPIYIAKKVDIVWTIPGWLDGEASLVGEVMLVRPNPDLLDPYVLLAYLRSHVANEEIQRMIRGQTAHLHPADLAELRITEKVLQPNKGLSRLSRNIQREVSLNQELNEIAYEQLNLLNRI